MIIQQQHPIHILKEAYLYILPKNYIFETKYNRVAYINNRYIQIQVINMEIEN